MNIENEKDLDAAITALIHWFRSQDLSPADGCIVMTKLIAMQFVLKNRDLNYLKESIRDHSELLTVEIAGFLR